MTNTSTFLIIGLGNPEPRYRHTPHNIGFMVIDLVRETLNLPAWKKNIKSNSLLSWNEDKNITLIKPQTFMNNSGLAVKSLLNKQLKPVVIIIHDDLALPIGTLRIGVNKSSGGHKGLESIISSLGHSQFIRIRVGVRPKTGQTEPAEIFVTKKFHFSKIEQELLEQSIKKAAVATMALLTHSLPWVQNEFNKK